MNTSLYNEVKEIISTSNTDYHVHEMDNRFDNNLYNKAVRKLAWLLNETDKEIVGRCEVLPFINEYNEMVAYLRIIEIKL